MSLLSTNRRRQPRSLCQLLLRSEEHTSELQSHHDLVCRLLLEKKKHKINSINSKRHPRQKTDNKVSKVEIRSGTELMPTTTTSVITIGTRAERALMYTTPQHHR